MARAEPALAAGDKTPIDDRLHMTARAARSLDRAERLDIEVQAEPVRSSGRAKRLDIQALRAFAVVSVVLYHLWPDRLVGGFTGVDIFFVISGYLMTTTLLRDIGPALDATTHRLRGFGGYFAAFYARRIRRLIPAAAAALLGVLGLVMATGQYVLMGKTASHVMAAAVFGENWKLADAATDYLAPTEAPTAVQHFWSLSVEEQFYAVWPLCLLVLALITLRTAARLRRTVTLLLVLAVALVSFAYGWHMTVVEPARAYFVTPARVWELIIGGFIVFLPVAANATVRRVLPWVGLALCLVSISEVTGDGFPGWHALIPTVGTALVIYGGSTQDGVERAAWSFNQMFRWRPVQWIGDVSYSLYLWHWPFIVLLPTLASVDIDGPHSLQVKAIILLFSFVAAWLSYRLVEQSTQRLKVRRITVFAAFLVIVSALVIGGQAVTRRADAQAVVGMDAVRAIAADEQVRCFGGRSIENHTECGDRFGEINKTWAWAVKADYSLNIIGYRRGPCPYFRLGDSNDPTNVCVLGDKTAGRNIVLWGDSHADQWANAMNAIGLKNHLRIVLLSSGGCANESITLPECSRRLDFIRKRGFLNASEAVIVSTVAKDVGTTSGNVLRTLRSMTDAPLYVVEDVPVASEQSGPDCYLTAKRCTESETWALQHTRDNLAALENSGLLTEDQVIRTSDMFCEQGTCYSFIGGVPVYRDTDNQYNSHISSVYSRSLAGLLEKKLKDKAIL